MENDGFLEFKWKGDQFLIFCSCSICIGSFSCRRSAFQMDDEGGQVSPKWKGLSALHPAEMRTSIWQKKKRDLFSYRFWKPVEGLLERAKHSELSDSINSLWWWTKLSSRSRFHCTEPWASRGSQSVNRYTSDLKLPQLKTLIRVEKSSQHSVEERAF